MKKYKIAAVLGAVTLTVLSYLVKEEKKNEVKVTTKEPA